MKEIMNKGSDIRLTSVRHLNMSYNLVRYQEYPEKDKIHIVL